MILDFQPLINRSSTILIIVADKGYNSKNNHFLVREQQNAISVVAPRFENTHQYTEHMVNIEYK